MGWGRKLGLQKKQRAGIARRGLCLVDWELLEERRGYPRGRRWRAFYCGDNRFDNRLHNDLGNGSRCEPRGAQGGSVGLGVGRRIAAWKMRE